MSRMARMSHLDICNPSYGQKKGRESNWQFGSPTTKPGELQRILYGGRWWLPPNPGRGESSESKCPWLIPTPKGVPKCELTLLWLVLDANSCEIIIVPLPSLIPGLLARPFHPRLVLEVRSGPQVPIFRNSTYLDLQVGLTRNLGVRHYERAKIVVTLFFFLRVPCLNFNHVIIMKDFHNFLHIIIGQNPNKSNSKRHYIF
jgi:hypothetical protein